MPKTAEQMNNERRAAKARQQAAKKARTVNKFNQIEFSLSDAQKEIASRQRFIAIREENERREVTEAFDSICKGAVRIEKFLNRDSWISFCFKIIKLIRQSNLEIQYNRDWKEAGYFAAGLVK